MTIKSLRIFKTVCETGSKNLESKKLFIDKPSISLAIKELEEHYGVKLFDRIGNRLHITDTGNTLLQYCNHILSLFDEMENEMLSFNLKGQLRIGTSITIGNILLANYINLLKEKYKDVDIKVTIENSDKIQQLILDNQIDIGLIEGSIKDKNIVFEKIKDDSLVFICSKNHPFKNKKNIDPKLLENHHFILREQGSASRDIFESSMFLNDINIKVSWESISTQAIINAVKIDFGISILPYLLVQKHIENKELYMFELDNISFKRDFNIIYHKNKYLSLIALDFIKICKEK